MTAPDREFCTLYPRFLETTETIPSRSRLNGRWHAIIEWNAPILTGRRVMDLGCHDGRWSFGALESGAAHVHGVEGRAHLVAKARENFRHYGVSAGRYALEAGDAIEALRAVKPGDVDVLMCLGFFYHTMEHMRLLLEAARIGVDYLIIDTALSPGNEPVIVVASESVDDTRNSIDYGLADRANALVGIPSHSALMAMLDYADFAPEFFDWDREHRGDWTDLHDYAQHSRVTLRARRRGRGPG
ncbi:MAG TPA: class I SAM-dependent methyltransferase [Stellaceae bacterium]|jgi:SAM-dependent methyltransferase|nr:class I SAM-dependent methyltransferase [Stellaceae bacterium]